MARILSQTQLTEAEWRIYASPTWTIIGSDNGQSAVLCQAIIWTKANIFIQEYAFENVLWKMSDILYVNKAKPKLTGLLCNKMMIEPSWRTDLGDLLPIYQGR